MADAIEAQSVCQDSLRYSMDKRYRADTHGRPTLTKRRAT